MHLGVLVTILKLLFWNSCRLQMIMTPICIQTDEAYIVIFLSSESYIVVAVLNTRELALLSSVFSCESPCLLFLEHRIYGKTKSLFRICPRYLTCHVQWMLCRLLKCSTSTDSLSLSNSWAMTIGVFSAIWSLLLTWLCGYSGVILRILPH